MAMTDKAVAPAGTISDRINSLAEVIRQGGDEAQQLRRLPQHTVDANRFVPEKR